MSSSQDFVDKIFSASTKLAEKGLSIADSTTQTVLRSVGDLKEKITSSPELDVFQPEQISSASKGIFSGLLPGIGSREMLRDNWMYGLSISATTLLIVWKCKQLLSLPNHVPQSQSLCVLVLGDINDPIVRSQVMDLYRRRFTVFICSENANNYKQFEEETDFIHPLNPASDNDLAYFTEYLTSASDPPRKLASVLFMPNLAYYPSGDQSVDHIEHELRSNVLVYYSTLVKLLPHLPDPETQLIMFNPSLAYNLGQPHHQTEAFVSGFISTIYNSLQSHASLNVNMVHVGLFQVRGQLSNYKYMNLAGSDISEGLHTPIYHMIMMFNGNKLQKIMQKACSFFGKCQVHYFGRFSYTSSLPFASFMIKLQTTTSQYFEIMIRFFQDNINKLR